jgi:hypothetical protein
VILLHGGTIRPGWLKALVGRLPTPARTWNVDVIAAVVTRRATGLDQQALAGGAELRVVTHAVVDGGDRGIDVGVGLHP